MKNGDTITASAWLTGEETAVQVQTYRDLVGEAVDDLCREMGFDHGPVEFYELHLGDERVPKVPDHIQGVDVCLLVGEAEVKFLPQIDFRVFVSSLDKVDLAFLRRLVRQRHWLEMPGVELSDMDADDIIEEIGPDAALDALRRGDDGRTLH